jgi:hypothetical protein
MPRAPTKTTTARLRWPYTVSAPEVIMMAWIGTTGTMASAVRKPKIARYTHAGVAIAVNSSVIGSATSRLRDSRNCARATL